MDMSEYDFLNMMKKDPDSFAVKIGLLPDLKNKYKCLTCYSDLKIYRDNQFKCAKCKCSISHLKGTIFENSKIPVKAVLNLIMFWLKEYSCKMIQKEPETYRISLNAIVSWQKKFRKIIVDEMDRIYQEAKIAGPDTSIQVDESKFGKVHH